MKFSLLFIFVLGTILALIPHIIYIIMRVIAVFTDIKVVYRPYGLTALGVFCVWSIVFLYGNQIGRFRHEIKIWEFADKNVPEAFDGYHIVHISDIHSGGWIGNEDKLKKIIEDINGLNPDLICFTGDIADLHPSEVTPLIPTLSKLKAKDGVISILGNHDYFPYARFGTLAERNENVDKLISMERTKIGWNLLLNDNTFIHRGNDSIAIIGSENQSLGAHPVIQRGKLIEAMKGTNGVFRILLTHDPTHWRGEVVGKTDIPLTLSGHTHAMQFRLFGWTPSSLVYSECDGLYKEGNQTLYVNIGLGGSLRMRIGATPEITLITLKRQK